MARLAALIGACGGLACEAGIEANTADVSGRWSFSESLADSLHGYSCSAAGTYDLTQAGDAFTGTFVQDGFCRTPTGLVDNSDHGPIDAGRVVGRTVRFRVPTSCEYEGSATGMPVAELAGRAVCVLQDGPRTLNFVGTWRATRSP